VRDRERDRKRERERKRQREREIERERGREPTHPLTRPSPAVGADAVGLEALLAIES
jgi:hypothetical protein